MCTTTGMYLIYEFMHFCCHVDENWFVRSCPFVNTLRRHHTAHHNARLMMETNMNLTFPIADWFFGTSDLDRGLICTLLPDVGSVQQATIEIARTVIVVADHSKFRRTALSVIAPLSEIDYVVTDSGTSEDLVGLPDALRAKFILA